MTETDLTMRRNALINALLANYLNNTPRFLTPEMVDDLAEECGVTKEEGFLSLFSASLGLDTAGNVDHRKLERLYLRPGVRRLDPTVYAADRYAATVRFPTMTHGNWQIGQGGYAPYEPFVWNHPARLGDLREIPQIGYFDTAFSFPAIYEGGVEWMTVKPNEIETMREPIRKSRGRVLTLGLGLGYFTFHASEKEDVTSVTVVERDPEVIDLFRSVLLPQFPHREKITILHADAFDFMEHDLRPGMFDSFFADLWHDASDGLELYLRLRKSENYLGAIPIDYWIEPSLLSYLRGMVYERLTDPTGGLDLRGARMEELLSDTFLKTLSPGFSKKR